MYDKKQRAVKIVYLRRELKGERERIEIVKNSGRGEKLKNNENKKQ